MGAKFNGYVRTTLVIRYMSAGPDAFLQYLTQSVLLHLAFATACSGLLFKLLQYISILYLTTSKTLENNPPTNRLDTRIRTVSPFLLPVRLLQLLLEPQSTFIKLNLGQVLKKAIELAFKDLREFEDFSAGSVR